MIYIVEYKKYYAIFANRLLCGINIRIRTELLSY